MDFFKGLKEFTKMKKSFKDVMSDSEKENKSSGNKDAEDPNEESLRRAEERKEKQRQKNEEREAMRQRIREKYGIQKKDEKPK